MFNATVTIYRRGETINADTGYREMGNQTTILRDEPCMFTQDARQSRSIFSSGMREFTKPTPGLVLDDVFDEEPMLGDLADVTWNTSRNATTTTYTIESFQLVPGIVAQRWFLTLSRING